MDNTENKIKTNQKPVFSKKQLTFLVKPLHIFNLLSGSVGAGKTFIANLKFIHTIYTEVPNNSIVLITGNTSETIYDNVVKDLIELTQGDIEFSQRPLRGQVKSKNIDIVCVGGSNERDWKRVQGKNVALWYGDEITLHPKSFVKICSSRVRTPPEKTIWTTNPDTPHHYIMQEYITNQNIDINTIYFEMDDNPVLSDTYKDKLKNTYTGVYYDRYILGKWVMSEGIVYSNFRPEHVIEINDIPEISEYILGIDWGYEHPLAMLLIGIDSLGTFYVVDEIFKQKQLIDNSLTTLLHEKGWLSKNITSAYADSARPDYIQQFYNLTGIPTLNADKDVQEGIHEVMKKLEFDNNRRSALYINDTCINTIREFNLYSRKQDTHGNMTDEVLKFNDDAMDALRYAIYSYSRQAKDLYITL